MIVSENTIIELNKIVGETGSLVNENMLSSLFSAYDYYESNIDRAVSIYRGIIKNHPFKDGNKRTAILFLLTIIPNSEDFDIDILENFVIDVTSNNYSVEEISEKLKSIPNFKDISRIT